MPKVQIKIMESGTPAGRFAEQTTPAEPTDMPADAPVMLAKTAAMLMTCEGLKGPPPTEQLQVVIECDGEVFREIPERGALELSTTAGEFLIDMLAGQMKLNGWLK